LLVAPALLQARRRSIALGAFILGVATLLGLLLILTPYTREYIITVLPRLSTGTEIVQNQSALGFSLRAQLLFAGHIVWWGRAAYVVFAVAILAFTLWMARGPQSAKHRAAVFAAFLALSPIISGLTWDIHLVTELLVIALIASELSPASGRWWAVVLAYLLLWAPRADLIAQTLGSPSDTTGSAFFLVATSLNLWGMLILWMACIHVLARPRNNLRAAETR
jgi:hypothetical protein